MSVARGVHRGWRTNQGGARPPLESPGGGLPLPPPWNRPWVFYRTKVLIILQVKEVIYNRIRHYVWAVYALQKMVSKHTHTLSHYLSENTHTYFTFFTHGGQTTTTEGGGGKGKRIELLYSSLFWGCLFLG